MTHEQVAGSDVAVEPTGAPDQVAASPSSQIDVARAPSIRTPRRPIASRVSAS